MLIIVSDLHMTDRETGAPVSDTELTSFVRHVQALEPRDEEITLLLLGDVIDFLRSEQWQLLWDEHEGAAPWSSLGPGFTGFEESLQEECLLRVAQGVEKRYSGFATALKDLKKNRKSRITYVAGNHDFMVQLSSKLRKQVADFLSLDDDPNKPFPLEFEDKKLGVYAEHGNRYDSTNWHQQQAGLWAIGDAVVLRIVNRFGALARKKLNLTDRTPLGRAIHEIDNVTPQVHIPLYVDWLGGAFLRSSTERKRLQKCWRETVQEFLALPDFQEDRYGKSGRAIRWLRRLYELADLERLLKHLGRIPAEIGVDYTLRAHLVKTDMQLRVFGHTHEPGIHALPQVDALRRFYANTGTWRRIIRRVAVGTPGIDFGGQRVSTYLVARAPGKCSLFSQCLLP
jgi:UDP-2,3-diacylglucosamine pyrophosphatase LpxH